MHRTKVILIGIDGCDFRILKPLLNEGYLPTFSGILENGSHGTLLSTMPPNSLPAWTSVLTGVNPGKHGLAGFRTGSHSGFKMINRKYGPVGSMWSILSTFGLSSIVVGEPVAYPPEKINGVMLTGFMTPPGSRNFAYPSHVRDEVDRVCGIYEPELPLGFREVIARNEDAGYDLISAFAEKTFRAAMYLAENYGWDLLSVTFTSTDRLQHFYFHKKPCISAHYAMLDSMIKSIIALEPEANVFIVSDHGFGPLDKGFYINTWLRERGFLVERQANLSRFLSRYRLTYKKIVSSLLRVKLYRLAARITPHSVKNDIPQHAGEAEVDRNRSLCFLLETNSGLYFNRSIADNNVSSLITDLLKSNMIDGENPIEAVYARDEVVWGPYADMGPDIYLLPKYGYEISPRLASTALTSPITFGDIRTGTHRPEGVFIACGSEISRGLELERPVRTWDIAPTLLHCLGIPIPSYMDGRVLAEIFGKDSGYVAEPVRKGVVSEREKIRGRLKKIKKNPEE